jgi:hypothetical protein
MSSAKKRRPITPSIDPFLQGLLGRPASKTLRRCIEQTGLSPEVLLRFGVDLVACHLAHLLPKHLEAVEMGLARWGNLPKETRTLLARRAVNARWAKYREQKAQQSLGDRARAPSPDDTDEG